MMMGAYHYVKFGHVSELSTVTVLIAQHSACLTILSTYPLITTNHDHTANCSTDSCSSAFIGFGSYLPERLTREDARCQRFS